MIQNHIVGTIANEHQDIVALPVIYSSALYAIRDRAQLQHGEVGTL